EEIGVEATRCGDLGCLLERESVHAIGELRVDRVGSDAPKPILRVPEISFAPVHDPVPVASGGRRDLLAHAMRVVEEIGAEEKAAPNALGHDAVRRRRPKEGSIVHALEIGHDEARAVLLRPKTQAWDLLFDAFVELVSARATRERIHARLPSLLPDRGSSRILPLPSQERKAPGRSMSRKLGPGLVVGWLVASPGDRPCALRDEARRLAALARI